MDAEADDVRDDGGQSAERGRSYPGNGAAEHAANSTSDPGATGAGSDPIVVVDSLLELDDFPNSRDGYHVRDYDGEDGISLWLELTLNGVVQQEISRKMWHASKGTPITFGRRDQARALLEAVARYLNTGGSTGFLEEVAREVCHTPSIDWATKGFYLFTTQQAAEARHIFFNEKTGKAIDWQEDDLITPCTIEDILDEFEDADEEDLDEEEDLQYSKDSSDEGDDSSGP